MRLKAGYAVIFVWLHIAYLALFCVAKIAVVFRPSKAISVTFSTNGRKYENAWVGSAGGYSAIPLCLLPPNALCNSSRM